MLKKNIILYLVIIALISLPFKLYTIDFSIPIHFDELGYTLDAFQYSNGDFFIPQKKNPGWPLFISPFLLVIDSSSFLDYSNLVRALTLGIATFSIFPMYLLARKFFNEKYSLVAALLFAFEPHLNYISGTGLSEPLFILVFFVSFLFILNKNVKLAYLAFIFAGIMWWIRLEGVYMIIALSVIYFLNYKKSPNLIKNFVLCVIILFVVVSPMFVQRYLQYDDPFYVWYGSTLFSEDYGELVTSPENASLWDYFENHSVISFIDRFIITGIVNIFDGLIRISYPFLFILIPFGIIFSFRAFDQNTNYVKANWIVILVTIGILIIPFSTINDRRFLFPLLPFLIIFSIIPIQRVVEYGLSTFSFFQKKKNIFLTIIICCIIILSGLFTIGAGKYGYGSPDSIKEHEKIEYARFLVNNLDGRILSGSTEYLKYIQSADKPDSFKTYKSNRDRDPYPDTYKPGSVTQISVYGDSIEELIINGEKRGLKYIAISGDGSYFFPFLASVYENEKQYPYLIKIFDSNEKRFQKYKVKVFEIDYKKFHSLLNNL